MIVMHVEGGTCHVYIIHVWCIWMFVVHVDECMGEWMDGMRGQTDRRTDGATNNDRFG